VGQYPAVMDGHVLSFLRVFNQVVEMWRR
jgi:hypothetical protein